MNGLNELMAVVGNRQKLHPDLEATMTKSDTFWMIQHPLMHTIYTPGFESLINESYRGKQEALADAIERGEYVFIITCLINKPHRLDAFLQYQDNLTDLQYWRAAGEIWTTMEFMHYDLERWDQVFDSDRSERDSIMNQQEQDELLSLPRMIEIYRGGSESGYSWTLDRKTAEWFAARYGHNHDIHTRKVPNKDVIALLNHRGEHEIIWRPYRG